MKSSSSAICRRSTRAGAEAGDYLFRGCRFRKYGHNVQHGLHGRQAVTSSSTTRIRRRRPERQPGRRRIPPHPRGEHHRVLRSLFQYIGNRDSAERRWDAHPENQHRPRRLYHLGEGGPDGKPRRQTIHHINGPAPRAVFHSLRILPHHITVPCFSDGAVAPSHGGAEPHRPRGRRTVSFCSSRSPVPSGATTRTASRSATTISAARAMSSHWRRRGQQRTIKNTGQQDHDALVDEVAAILAPSDPRHPAQALATSRRQQHLGGSTSARARRRRRSHDPGAPVPERRRPACTGKPVLATRRLHARRSYSRPGPRPRPIAHACAHAHAHSLAASVIASVDIHRRSEDP